MKRACKVIGFLAEKCDAVTDAGIFEVLSSVLMLIPGKELCLRSIDNRFGIQLEAIHVASLIAECQKAGNQETGGILIGHYSRDHAMAFVTN